MINKHSNNLYNILLTLSRNIFFYKDVKLKDSFETRIYLMFMHFSIILIIYKRNNIKFNQKDYDFLFNNIENNLRELGFGDVTVNKKMKEFNKILYDILLKLDLNSENKDGFSINHDLVTKYFKELNDINNAKFTQFATYFTTFFNFCFEQPLDSMIESSDKFNF